MKKKGNRVYYVFDMQVPGAIFIKVADWARPHIDVKKVGFEIVKDLKQTKELSARFVCKLIPVDFLCKANNFEDFKLMVEPVLPKYFPMAGKPDSELLQEGLPHHIQWSMEFKRRNNDKVDRKAFLDFLGGKLDPARTSMNYDETDIDIVVEVFRDMLLVAILPGYKRDYKKYNL